MQTIVKFDSIELFETRKLVAKRVQANGLDKFILMHSNQEVMATLGGVLDKKQTIENLNWNLNQWKENGFGLWMFYLKESLEWIGRGGIRRVKVNNKEEIEIGYALMPLFWQQGYATEITKASLEIAFEILKLNNIVSFTLTSNKASQRVMQKAGFQYECQITHANLPHFLYRIKIPD